MYFACTDHKTKVNKQHVIMSIGGQKRSPQRKNAQSSVRGLLKAIEQNTRVVAAYKRAHTTHHYSGHQAETQTKANKTHSKKGPKNGHMGHMSECIIISTTMHDSMETTSHETNFVTLKRTIRASLNHIDPLINDKTEMWRKRNQIRHASVLKHRNVLYHRKLPLMMNKNILRRSRLNGRHKY
jgi:hypothetical protein